MSPTDRPTNPPWRAVAARCASLLLRYPDADVLAAGPTIAAALPGLPAAIADRLRPLVTHRTTTDPDTLAVEYVELFDFRRRCCLHLTYYTAGDTRRRGQALASVADAYRAAGWKVADGELPDYLPAVLDLAAVDQAGWRLLHEHRIGLDLLAQALATHRSVYRHAVEAVRAMLPAPRPADLAAVAHLARTGPPREAVGLEPYGSRSNRTGALT